MRVDKLRAKLDRKLEQLRWARQSVRQEKASRKAASSKMKISLEARDFLQGMAKEVQASAHRQVSAVVSKCLKAVFGDKAYGFRIDFVKKRGKTEAMLVLERDGYDLTDPLNEAGGGPCEVAAFALRLASLALRRPKPRMLLCLDEPFRSLSPEYRSLVPSLLESLARELSIQFVITTNQPEIECGKVIRLRKKAYPT